MEKGELVDMVELDDLELRVEVFVDGHFAGQVQLEGRDMLRQCYRAGDGRVKRAIGYKLLPRHDEKVKVSAGGRWVVRSFTGVVAKERVVPHSAMPHCPPGRDFAAASDPPAP